jgi:energy-coupling factor transport system substrate-specific component
MLGCGFVGLFAGLIGAPFQKAPLTARVIALGSYGALAGFAYGMLLDLWDWPLLLNDVHSGVGFAPGLPFAELIRRFSGFYLASSLFYDAFRAAGNLILVLVVGGPLIVALERFRLRFLLEWRAADASNIPQHARIRSAGAAGGTGRAS